MSIIKIGVFIFVLIKESLSYSCHCKLSFVLSLVICRPLCSYYIPPTIQVKRKPNCFVGNQKNYQQEKVLIF